MPGWRPWPTSRACSEPPGAYHLGFLLGPRVNAGGRVGQADLGARLLSSDDPHEVGALALRLDEFNAERRAIEREVLDQAIARIEGLYGPDRKGLPAALVVESEGWHVGVIGIVASRLVERYGRPAFVIGMDGELGKGSGRSVQRRRSRRRGDRGAPGRACWSTAAATPWRPASPWRETRCRELAKFLDERIAPQLGAAPPVRELGIDAALAPGAATQELVDMIERAGPFGAGNALPRFALTGVRVDLRPAGGRGPCALHPGRRASAAASRRSPSAPARRRSGRRCSIRHARSCMSRARCASTATAAAKACACRSTMRPRRRVGFGRLRACLISRPRSRYMQPLFTASSPSSRGLGHRPFTAATRVRIP